jgi:uncharacterized protein with ParB-like and HNH nuclease domain
MSGPASKKTLDLYPIDYPFETLVSRISSDNPKLLLNPDFQRKYKWDKEGWERSSRFIESCLMRIPLPSCYFAEDKEGRHIVIDGVQRLTTIVKFLNDEFKLEGLSTFKELEGKKFSQLGDYKSELEATTIRCIILRKENPQSLIREIFSRLNQGAVSLSDQEIRHALYPGKFDDLLKKLAAIDTIKKFGKGSQSESTKDSLEAEEQVLRYFAFSSDLSSYGDRLSRFLDKYMESQQDLDNASIKSLESEFTKNLSKCITVFKGNAFKDMSKTRTKQSMVYYDLLMHSLGGISETVVKKKRQNIQNAFDELCSSQAFQKTLSGGLQNKSSIIKRRGIWDRILTKHLK